MYPLLRFHHLIKWRKLLLNTLISSNMFYITLFIGTGKRSSHNMPMQAQKGGRGLAPNHLQTSTSRKWVVSTMPWPLYPRERSSTGGWMGLRVWSGWAQKVLPAPGLNPHVIQPIVSHYADHAIPFATYW